MLLTPPESRTGQFHYLSNQITNHYITDADAWFLIAEKAEHGLIMLEREPFNVQTDVEFSTRSMLTAAWGRFDSDWINNGIGLYGSPGA